MRLKEQRGFPAVWLNRCTDPKDREEFKEYLLNCRRLFNELEYILEAEEAQMTRQEVDYNDASWAFKAAHHNGMREMLSRIKKLIP